MSRSQQELVNEALLHLDKAMAYGRMDTTQDHVVDAIALRIAAAIDAMNRLPSQLLSETFGDDWPAMKAMRNRITHGYLTVKPGRDHPGRRPASTWRLTVSAAGKLLQVELLNAARQLPV